MAIPPISVQLRAMCDEYRAALIVDEAHALGVFGPQGSGHCRQFGLKPDVIVGTFGKAIGAQGAFVGTGAVVRDWLWNRARSLSIPLLCHLFWPMRRSTTSNEREMTTQAAPGYLRLLVDSGDH